MLAYPSNSSAPDADCSASSSACIDAAFASPVFSSCGSSSSFDERVLFRASSLVSAISASTHSIDSIQSVDTINPPPPPVQCPEPVASQLTQPGSDDSIDAHFRIRTSEASDFFLREYSDEDVLNSVSRAIELILVRSDGLPTVHSAPTIFDAAQIPSLTVRHFLQFVLKERMCSRECLALALVYCERLLQRHPSFRITRLNIHRLLLTLIIVSTKMIDDHYCRNSYFSKATRIHVQDVNAMELKLCDLLNFELHVGVEEFSAYWQTFSRFSASAPSSPLLSPRRSMEMLAASRTSSLQSTAFASHPLSASFPPFDSRLPSRHPSPLSVPEHSLRPSQPARPNACEQPLTHPEYSAYLQRLAHNFETTGTSAPRAPIPSILPPVPPIINNIKATEYPAMLDSRIPAPPLMVFPPPPEMVVDCDAFFALTMPHHQIWEFAPPSLPVAWAPPFPLMMPPPFPLLPQPSWDEPAMATCGHSPAPSSFFSSVRRH